MNLNADVLNMILHHVTKRFHPAIETPIEESVLFKEIMDKHDRAFYFLEDIRIWRKPGPGYTTDRMEAVRNQLYEWHWTFTNRFFIPFRRAFRDLQIAALVCKTWQSLINWRGFFHQLVEMRKRWMLPGYSLPPRALRNVPLHCLSQKYCYMALIRGWGLFVQPEQEADRRRFLLDLDKEQRLVLKAVAKWRHDQEPQPMRRSKRQRIDNKL
jgi:hypothetical protein